MIYPLIVTTLLRIDRFQARRTLATFFDISMGIDLDIIAFKCA